MVIAEINSGNHGSVGNIMLGIAKTARSQGNKVYTFCPPGHMQKQQIQGNFFIGTVLERRICDSINYYTGYQGSLNYVGTYQLIKKLKALNPDIIQLHNLHSNYVNLKMLFKYLSKSTAHVFWTLHDCWAFTGNVINGRQDAENVNIQDIPKGKEILAIFYTKTKKICLLR